MANPFGLDQFIAEIGKGGVAKASNFYVTINSSVADRHINTSKTITVPLGPTAKSKEKERFLPLRIESVNMPGRSLTTAVRHTVGRPRHMPIASTILPIQISVLLSEDMWERQYFMAWQDHFVGDLRVSGQANETGETSGIGYYKDGYGSMTVLQFAESPSLQGRRRDANPTTSIGNTAADIALSLGMDPRIVTHPLGFNLFGLPDDSKLNITHATKITFHEVYPVTVNDIAMSWTDEGLARLTVELRYAYFTEEHAFADVQLAADKSALRKAMEGFNRFIPAISLIKNVGVFGAVGAVGRSAAGVFDGQIGTIKTVNPFSS